MAELEADLRAYLLTLTPVTALVGTGATARIRPDRLHESDDRTQPAVIIEVDSEDPENDLMGVGGLVYASVNLRCRALEKEDSRSLAEAIRLNGTDPGTGLAGFSGTAGSMSIDAVLENTSTSFVKDDDGSDQGFYDTNCLYEISHSEVI